MWSFSVHVSKGQECKSQEQCERGDNVMPRDTGSARSLEERKVRHQSRGLGRRNLAGSEGKGADSRRGPPEHPLDGYL